MNWEKCAAIGHGWPALALYDCHAAALHDGGDHTIFVGRVEALGFGAEGKQPLVYFANRYTRIRD